MIEENAIQEAEMVEEGEFWQTSWYAKGQSSDGLQRRFSFECQTCNEIFLDDADQRLHMTLVHGATHFIRDITETEIRIMNLQQFGTFIQEMLKMGPC